MSRTQIKVSRKMLITWFFLAGIIFLCSPSELTGKFQSVFAHIFRLPLRVGRGVSLSARIKTEQKDDFSKSKTRYQNHIDNLSAQLDLAHEQINKLSGLRNRLPLEGAGLIRAGIIRASLGKSNCEFLIDHGANDNIVLGQFVISDNSIIGKITELWARNAKVQLITSPTFTAAVKIKGLNKNLLMLGTGNGSAKIITKTKLKIGKKVIANPTPGFLDSPMVIGKVVDCKTHDENPLLWDIIVEPACSIELLTDVAVIIMNPQQAVRK